MTQYKPDLVYFISPQTSLLKTNGRKFSQLYWAIICTKNNRYISVCLDGH